MIVRMLVDLNSRGYLYLLTIQTEDEQKLFNTLKLYSNDVRFLEEKKEKTKRDKGTKVLQDGSIVLQCKFFCDKVSNLAYNRRSTYITNELKRAIVV